MMMKHENIEDRTSESGNVLFLILIAVALFAALSYAVTQSTRSGGGDTTGETSLISSTQVTQYQASVRTAILRMMVTNSVEPTELLFDDPTLFAAFCDTPANSPNCVFHPDGGAASYQVATSDVVSVAGTAWVYNSENQVDELGRFGAANAVNNVEIVAFLPNVRQGVCERINKELGIAGVPVETGIDVTSQTINTNAGLWAGSGTGIINGASNELDNQPFGCFAQGSPAVNYYYHVLVEQ